MPGLGIGLGTFVEAPKCAPALGRIRRAFETAH